MKKLPFIAALAWAAGFSYAAADDFPQGTSWPDLPKETSFPAAVGTLPEFSYRVDSKKKGKQYAVPGIGVTMASGGSAMYAGAVTVLLNYNLTANTGDVFKNALAPVVRIGLGNRWDIALAVPQMYMLKDSTPFRPDAAPFGAVGSLGVTLHKQHMAKKFGESALSVATNYIIGIPVSAVPAGYNFGWGVGASWQYHQMSAQFDITAAVYTDAKNPQFASKGGYFYAFNNYLYTGVEYNWDYTPGKNPGYMGFGSHQFVLGPIISVKVPKLKNTALGAGVYYDVINYWENPTAKIQPWKFASRLSIFF